MKNREKFNEHIFEHTLNANVIEHTILLTSKVTELIINCNNLQFFISENIKIIFNEDKITKINLNIVFKNLQPNLNPNISFSLQDLSTKEVYIEELSCNINTNKLIFDFNIENIAYFVNNYVNARYLFFKNNVLKFGQNEISKPITYWKPSGDKEIIFKLKEKNIYIVKEDNSPYFVLEKYIIIKNPKSIMLKDIYFPIVLSNSNVDIYEYDLNIAQMSTLIIKDSICNIKNFKSDLNYLYFNETDLSTTKKIPVFNAKFENYESLLKIKDIGNFGNLKNKKYLNLVIFEESKIDEHLNLFNMLLCKIFDFKLKIQVALILLLFFILCGSVIFNQKDMTPSDSIINLIYLQNIMKKQHVELNVESNESWSYPDGYQQFNPLLYTLDLSLPFLDLGQTKTWVPIFDDKRLFVNVYFYFIKIISKLLLLFSVIKIIEIWKNNGETDEE